MGGGGGGGSTSYSAQGTPPSFDYLSPTGLNQMAIGADVQSYALSDQDFANRYPQLQNAYNQYQANLNQQTGLVGQGQVGQANIMAGLGRQLGGGAGTDIGNIRGAAGTVGGIGSTMQGLGQQLINEPIDPQTQQQMMRAGLGTAAGALGAASLGQGMAGQSAAARQLGLSTLQYGQAMRQEGAGYLGQAAQMAGAAGGLYGQAGGLQNQLAGTYGGMQAQQAQNLLGNIANSGQLFAKRPFGLGGTNLAQSELSQAGAFNSFQQANYATMNGIAYNSAQLNAQQAQLQAQQNASLLGAGVSLAGTGATAAIAGAAISALSCWVARAVYRDERWKIFRHWLLHHAPVSLRVLYLRHGRSFSLRVERSRLLRSCLKLLFDRIIARTTYVGTA